MSENDALTQRIDELEKTIFDRLDRLEQIVLKDRPTIPAAAPIRENRKISEKPAGIEQEANAKLESITAANQATPEPTQSAQTPAAAPAPPRETPQWIKNLTDIEWLTSRIGISLLLIGVITSFFWLNNRPWVTDGMRLATGYGISTILLGLGLRLSNDRPSFGQLLAGGGVAAAYITTFIGHFILEAIPDITTIIIVFGITMLTYGLDVWKKQQSLAYVGLIFGLITPPIVSPENPSIPAFVGYICLVLLGPIAIYYSLRSTYLLFTAAAFGWIYMFALASAEVADITPIYANQLAIQGAILFCFIGFGVVPLVREWLDRVGIDPADILAFEAAQVENEAESEEGKENEGEKPPRTLANPFAPHWTLFPYITASPILAAGISLLLWPALSSTLWATLMVVGAAIYFAAGYWMGQDKRFEVLQLPLFIVGAILLLFSPLKASGNLASILLILFSAEAIGFALFSQRQNKSLVMLLPHLLFVGAFLTWVGGIMPESIENPFFNLNFLASILFIGSLAAFSWMQEAGVAKNIYQFLAHLLFLPISGFEIEAAAPSESYWLLFHILLHVGVFALGIQTKDRSLRYQGIVFAGFAMLTQSFLDLAGDLTYNVVTWPNLMLYLAAGQVVAVCASGKLWKDKWVTIGGYALSAIGMFALISRLISAEFTIPFVGLSSLSTLSMLIALLVVALWYSGKTASMIIGVVTHFLALIWLAVQSQDFTNDQMIITALWAVYSIALLISGLVFDKKIMRNLGIGTILLTVAKLLLFDLENVSTGGRVMLFSGFGVVLLVISYFTRTLWRRDEEAMGNGQ